MKAIVIVDGIETKKILFNLRTSSYLGQGKGKLVDSHHQWITRK
jgi:hypothetical protein